MGIFRYLKNYIGHDRYMRHAIKEQQLLLKEITRKLKEGRLQQRIDYLKDKTLNSTEKGVSDERYCEHEVIVSLTSFGKRIFDVYLAIESIMQGTIKPNKIILWLSENEFNGKMLPHTLQLQQVRGLEIKFCKDLRSYTKLIPSLKLYPDACIITIDDDVIYEYDIVERLVNAHLNSPHTICACRVHIIKFDSNNCLKSYMDWDWEACIYEEKRPVIFATGVGGVLYPSQCFSDEVFNENVFMDICPYADDVWFYAMALLNNTTIIQVYTGQPGGYYMELPSSSIDALQAENTNVAICRNDIQIKAVFEKYGLYNKII